MDKENNESSALPQFTTERLVLREVAASNIPSYQKYFSHYEIIRHLSSFVPWPFPDNGVESFLNSNIFPEQGKTQWLWGIFEKINPDLSEQEIWELKKDMWLEFKSIEIKKPSRLKEGF